MTDDLPILDLVELLDGMPGLTTEVAACFVQAAGFCLEGNSHVSGTTLDCTGHKNLLYRLAWPSHPDKEQRDRTWQDKQFATESGAYAVAIALVRHISSKVVWARSAKGPGFDFWLGEADATPPPLMFQGTSRLEVSGILNDQSQIASRMKQKIAQISPSNGSGTDAYVVVVEFGSPQACVAHQ